MESVINTRKGRAERRSSDPDPALEARALPVRKEGRKRDGEGIEWADRKEIDTKIEKI